LDRLRRNASPVDLVLTTDGEDKAAALAAAARGHAGAVRIVRSANLGRNIAPFVDLLGADLAGYDVVAHAHGERSLGVDGGLGERWRTFLWDNLIGGAHAMLDLAAVAFEHDPTLGLVMAEDPHLVGWNANRAIAAKLSQRMGL